LHGQPGGFVAARGSNNGYDGQYAGYRLSAPRNGGSARFQGFELSYQQQFTFLPGIWRSFGVNLNYTQLETEGNYGAAIATTQLAGFIPRTANASISFLRRGWTIRVNVLWRDTYLRAVNANAALLGYQRARTQVALKLRYDVSPRLGFYCNIDRVLWNDPYNSTYVGRAGTHRSSRFRRPAIRRRNPRHILSRCFQKENECGFHSKNLPVRRPRFRRVARSASEWMN